MDNAVFDILRRRPFNVLMGKFCDHTVLLAKNTTFGIALPASIGIHVTADLNKVLRAVSHCEDGDGMSKPTPKRETSLKEEKEPIEGRKYRLVRPIWM